MNEAYRFDDSFREKFEVEKVLGKGAMGAVFLCTQKSLARKVAVKILHSGLDKRIFLKRFKREAELLCTLNHPNIVKFYDYGHSGDTPYIVQEFLSGKSLDRFLTSKAPLPLDFALDLSIQIAKGLVYSHNKKVIHRDLKPGNIFLTKDNVIKLIDFGLALGINDSTRLTETGTVVGTPYYMAPELFSLNKATHLVDLYALGAIIYYMVAGEQPFDDSDMVLFTASKIAGTIRPIEDFTSSSFPKTFKRLIENLLEAKPEKRIQNASLVLDELQKIVSSLDDRALSYYLPTQRVSIISPKRIDQESSQDPQERSKGPFFWLSLFLFSMAILYIGTMTREREITHTEFLMSKVTPTALTLRISAKATQRCNLSCKILSSKTNLTYNPMNLGQKTEWSATVGPLQPNCSYKVELTLFKDSRVKETKSFTIKTPSWNPKTFLKNFELAHAPAVHGDDIVISEASGRLSCYSLHSAQLIWRKTKDVGPCALLTDGKSVFVAETSRHFVQALELSTGNLLWKQSFEDEADNTFFITDKNVYVRIRKSAIHCLDKLQGKEIWRSSKYARAPWITTEDSVIHKLVGLTIPSRTTREANTGKTIFQSQSIEAIASTDFHQLNDEVFYGTQNGKIVRGQTDKLPQVIIHPKGKAIRITGDDELLFVLYLNPSQIAAYELKTGERRWSKPLSLLSERSCTLSCYRKLVFLTSNDGLVCFSAISGLKLYENKSQCAGLFAVTPTQNGFIHSHNRTTVGLLPSPKDWPPDVVLMAKND